jgi:DNA-binding GntR family transcriptional regulator
MSRSEVGMMSALGRWVAATTMMPAARPRATRSRRRVLNSSWVFLVPAVADGPTTGVIARMDSIGEVIDRVVEKVTARAATHDEVKWLQLPPRGAYVLVIDRTHYVGDKPVEACDIVFPGDRYELTYTIPVD